MLKFVMRQGRSFCKPRFVTNGLLFSSIFVELKLILSPEEVGHVLSTFS